MVGYDNFGFLIITVIKFIGNRTGFLAQSAVDALVPVDFRVPEALDIRLECYGVFGADVAASIAAAAIDLIRSIYHKYHI